MVRNGGTPTESSGVLDYHVHVWIPILRFLVSSPVEEGRCHPEKVLNV